LVAIGPTVRLSTPPMFAETRPSTGHYGLPAERQETPPVRLITYRVPCAVLGRRHKQRSTHIFTFLQRGSRAGPGYPLPLIANPENYAPRVSEQLDAFEF